MTHVGKILVFFNLLFSLAVGALTVLNFTARTHWVDGYNKLSNRTQIAEASVASYKQQNQALQDERQALFDKIVQLGGKTLDIKDPNEAGQKIVKALDDANRQITQQKDTIRELTDARSKAEQKLAKEEVTLKVALEDVKRRQADVEKIRDTLRIETDNNTKLVKEKNELRDRAVGAEIQARAYKDTNTRLETEIQDMAKAMARLKASAGSGTASAKGANPPPDNVEGQIKRTDANSGLVTLSIGSDAGLSKGNTMEVFRLGPTPRYVGRIRIVEVTNNQSVGQVVGRLSGGPIQVGDRVASQILR
jgi:hypothetical protein